MTNEEQVTNKKWGTCNMETYGSRKKKIWWRTAISLLQVLERDVHISAISIILPTPKGSSPQHWEDLYFHQSLKSISWWTYLQMSMTISISLMFDKLIVFREWHHVCFRAIMGGVGQCSIIFQAFGILIQALKVKYMLLRDISTLAPLCWWSCNSDWLVPSDDSVIQRNVLPIRIMWWSIELTQGILPRCLKTGHNKVDRNMFLFRSLPRGMKSKRTHKVCANIQWRIPTT